MKTRRAKLVALLLTVPVLVVVALKIKSEVRGSDRARAMNAKRGVRVQGSSSARLFVPAMTDTRDAWRARLVFYFGRELLRRELLLEQECYGPEYWRAAPVSDSREHEARRRDLVRQLTNEANDLLHDAFPGADGDEIVLTSAFDAEHPAPNVSFLSAQALERLLDVAWARGAMTGEEWRLSAEAALDAAELAQYRTWNDPDVRGLREQMLGFEPTEKEFNAIRVALTETDQDAGDPDAAAVLKKILGPERWAAWQRQRSPEMQGALRDLQRLGLPVESATWLADYRRQVIAKIDQVWRDEELPDYLKQNRVEQLRQNGSTEIKSRLGLLATADTETDFFP